MKNSLQTALVTETRSAESRTTKGVVTNYERNRKVLLAQIAVLEARAAELEAMRQQQMTGWAREGA